MSLTFAEPPMPGVQSDLQRWPYGMLFVIKIVHLYGPYVIYMGPM